MYRLKSFLREMAAVNVSSLDVDFLNRAQKITTFNLRPTDMQTTRYKSEIQHLFNRHFFKDFDLSKTIKGQPSVTKLNTLIDMLQKESMTNYNKLHFYNLKGVGPGEATLYFLLDDAVLGGGGSAGVDLMVGSKKYEIKASLHSKSDNTVYGFKFGGTEDLSKMVTQIVKWKNELGLKSSGKGVNEVGPKNLEIIKKKYPSEWRKLEAEYSRIGGRYFGNTPVIFISNNTSMKVDPDGDAEKIRQLSAGAGKILSIGPVTAKDISIQTVTQGTIKPRVKI